MTHAQLIDNLNIIGKHELVQGKLLRKKMVNMDLGN